MKKVLFFTYGSLKRGYWNNILLKKSKFLGEHITNPEYTLYNGGFPVVERNGNTAIHGELFLCEDENTISNVFDLEGCSSQIQGDKNNWYDYDKINTQYGEAIIFVMDKGKSNRTQILKSGIWK